MTFPEITGYFQLFNPDKSGVNMDAPARHLRGETQLPMTLDGFSVSGRSQRLLPDEYGANTSSLSNRIGFRRIERKRTCA